MPQASFCSSVDWFVSYQIKNPVRFSLDKAHVHGPLVIKSVNTPKQNSIFNGCKNDNFPMKNCGILYLYIFFPFLWNMVLIRTMVLKSSQTLGYRAEIG